MNLFRRIFTRQKPLPSQLNTYFVELRPGQQCWELNTLTGDIAPYTLLPTTKANLYGLQICPDCMYEIAVNKKNAVRKLTERLKVINQNGGLKKQ